MNLPLEICKEDGLLYNVFRCFYCGFVNRAMVCKAISRDWRCCLASCWVACWMHSLPTVWSLLQFFDTLNSPECLRCSLVICSEGALEPWTKLFFTFSGTPCLQFILLIVWKKPNPLMKCSSKCVWKAYERCRTTLGHCLQSLTCDLVNLIYLGS